MGDGKKRVSREREDDAGEVIPISGCGGRECRATGRANQLGHGTGDHGIDKSTLVQSMEGMYSGW